jgi:hypothetical protein
LEIFANLFESTWRWEGFWIDPAFEFGAGLSFDNVGRIDTNVKAEE